MNNLYTSITQENSANPIIPADKSSDYFCGRGKYCEIGAAFVIPESTDLYGRVSKLELSRFYNVENDSYNLLDMQRIYVSTNPFLFEYASDIAWEMGIQPCEIYNVCTRNDYYFDEVY